MKYFLADGVFLAHPWEVRPAGLGPEQSLGLMDISLGTKLRMIGRSRDSDEPAKESADTISAMNALELAVRTVHALYENGKLTDEQQAKFLIVKR